MKRKRIVLAGGSGFLGTEMRPIFEARGYECIVLTRRPRLGVPSDVQWDAKTTGPWARALEEATAVVNLVGRSVDCRKTDTNKRAILESRVDSMHALAAAVRGCSRPPGVWVQSATAHIFGDTHDQVLDESSPSGEGLAPDVGRAWEAALMQADLPGLRKVILRISFVLGRSGGALAKLTRLARWGMGGTVASGRQWISWLHVVDLAEMVLWAIEREAVSGIYVATAPQPVTNREFMRQLRRAVHRPWAPPAPETLVRIASWFMNTDPTLATLGRRCVPARLLREGFAFQHPCINEALADLLSGKQAHG